MIGIDSLYNALFTVSRPTRTSDGQGGWAVSYVEAGTLRGRLRPASTSERSVARQEQAQISHVFYCAAEADLRRGDLVSGAGQTVEVQAIREPSHAGHHWECDCVETQKEAQVEAGS